MSLTVFATGLIIGTGLGTGLTYIYYQRKFLEQQQNFSRGMRRTIEELEKAHESRLQETAHSLRADYERQQHAASTPMVAAADSVSGSPAQPGTGVAQRVASPAPETTTEPKLPSLKQESAAPAMIRPGSGATDGACQVSEGLRQKLMAWGQAGQSNNIPLVLNYVRHGDRTIRAVVATAIAQIARSNPQASATQNTLLALDQLSRDTDVQVRQAAVEALGTIRSSQVIPLLERAARDPARKVAKLASNRLRRYRFYPSPQVPRSRDPLPKVTQMKQSKR